MDDKQNFLAQIPVSHEAIEKLDKYAELIRSWNENVNLVADSTIPHIWTRHFLDSAQILKYMPDESRTIADLGSGAGFPGVVLSILSHHQVHLVESIGKKANFLKTVVAELGLKATVHHARAEDIKNQFDIVTARALKPLPELLKLAKPLIKKNGFCLFLKGEKSYTEVAESAKSWAFDCQSYQSLSNPQASILKLSQLGRKS